MTLVKNKLFLQLCQNSRRKNKAKSLTTENMSNKPASRFCLFISFKIASARL